MILLAADALLLAVHAVHLVLRRWGAEQNIVTDFLLNTVWNGQNDRSVVEIWGYLQLATAALLLFYLSFRQIQGYAYAVWALIFLIMTADDVLEWHENIGAVFSDSRSDALVFGAPAYAVGQILFWALVAAMLGALLLLAHRRSSPATRRGSTQLMAGTVLLAVFAVGVDLISAIVMETMGRTAYAVTVYIETIGELVFMSVILIVVLRLSTQYRAGKKHSSDLDLVS
ncbi:hypothetical protein [Kocuria rosea]|uniref:Uncharacterized protein n=1 Tax=Kocuria rosea TaxID=1275 RepID=A0A4R5YCM1_KOCRO|nr:hypothetical protein [Kocuria rosea]TDL42444.1 hypothetical protein E2R59_10890 [Kocuria rosea]